MEFSALSEIGNILAGSYLSSLADFTSLSMFPTVPALAMDMAGPFSATGCCNSARWVMMRCLLILPSWKGKMKLKANFS